MRGVEFELSGLSVHRAIGLLGREGIPVLSAAKTTGNGLKIVVGAKERKKAFTILKRSCYNIREVRAVGALRLAERLRRAVGLVVGGAAALSAVLFLQGRVLRVEVTGSGAYLEPEIRAVLSEKGIGRLSGMPAPEDVLPDILSLPRVHFCSVKGESGVLTVCVEVSDDASPLVPAPLCAPASGKIEELLVLRGTPLFSVGDEVAAGEEIVGAYEAFNEERRACIVSARVRISFPVLREYPLGEREALAQAYLDFGELSEVRTQRTAEGWRVEGVGHADRSVNFG